MSDREEPREIARTKGENLRAAIGTSKGPKKRDPACLQLQQDIIIPKGTIMRQEPGKQGTFKCPASYAEFTIEGMIAHQHADIYKLVVVG